MKDKIVLITGGASGIGEAAAKQFAGLGARVVLLDRDEKNLKRVSDEIQGQGGKAHYFLVDIGDYRSVVRVCEQIKKEVGVPDVIINGAGGGKWRFVEETEYEEIVEMTHSCFLGAFFLTKAFMPEMLARNSGHIVNVSSMAAQTPFAGATGYIATRKAMIGLHEALNSDFHRTKLKASLVYFARVDSPFWKNNPGSADRLPGAQGLIRTISVEEAAHAIVQGVLKGKKNITAPFMIRFLLVMGYLNPFVNRALIYLTEYQRKKTA